MVAVRHLLTSVDPSIGDFELNHDRKFSEADQRARNKIDHDQHSLPIEETILTGIAHQRSFLGMWKRGLNFPCSVSNKVLKRDI